VPLLCSSTLLPASSYHCISYNGNFPARPCLTMLFWVVMPCGLIGGYQCFAETYCLHNFIPEDADSIFLENVGIYLQVHMASQPRRAAYHLCHVRTSDLTRPCLYTYHCVSYLRNFHSCRFQHIINIACLKHTVTIHTVLLALHSESNNMLMLMMNIHLSKTVIFFLVLVVSS
jgi:hypothetical protein